MRRRGTREHAVLGVRHRTGTRGDTAGMEHERDRGRAREAGAGRTRAGGHGCESRWLGRSAGSPIGLTFGSK
jgi:hypothetical protein